MSKEKASQRISGNIGKSNVKKKVSPLVIIFPVIIVAVIVGILIIAFVGKESDANVVVTPDNVEEIIAQLREEERVPIGSYEVAMNTEWTFPDSKTASEDAYVSNAVTNNSTVYFDITLEGSTDVIYKSPYIPVGSSVQNITLDNDMDKGVYEAVLTYHLVDESYKETSKVSVGITITIQN